MSNPATPGVLGIDFGTSNSAAGIACKGVPRLVRVEGAETTLPTSVFYDAECKSVRFGRAANRSLVSRDDGRFMRALKSVLGTSIMHEPRYLNGKRVTFVDVIAGFLAHLKQSAEDQLQREFTHALSGRPVRFHSNNDAKDAQALNDLTDCYKAAGFAGVDFLTEPEAAARAAGSLAVGELALIVDIGGGTSDFCLFEAGRDSIEVLATRGVRVGGTDFDRSLSMDHVMPLLGRGHFIREQMGSGTLPAPNWISHDLATWEKIPGLYSAKPRELAQSMAGLAVNAEPFRRLDKTLTDELGHDIAFAVERGKIETNLSGQSQITLPFAGPTQGSRLQVGLSAATLDDALRRYGREIRASALETLKIAGSPTDKLDSIIFVGGSSLMKMVEAAVAPEFANARLHYSDAFTAIVDGLSISAEEMSVTGYRT